MKTSVILCTYNGERYLQEQLDSIANQTVLPDEIVVSDDASTDGTLGIILSFAREHKHLNIRLICNEANLGYVRNFSNAISHASGDIVFLCDQDDIWNPQKIEVFLDSFEMKPVVTMVFSDLELMDGAGKNLHVTFRKTYWVTRKHRRNIAESSIQSPLLRYNLVTGASMAFRATLVPVLYPIPDGIPHDYWIALVAASRKDAICSLEKSYTSYRIHANQAIGLGKVVNSGAKPDFDWGELDRYYRLQIGIWKTLYKRIFPFADACYLLQIKKKLRHARLNRFHALRRRKARSENLFGGLVLILEEAIHLRYKYSRGLLSFGRDFFSIVLSAKKIKGTMR